MAEEKGTTEEQSVPLELNGIMKILFNLSDALTIRMINSLFNKNIPLEAKVIPMDVELHRFSQSDSM